MEIENTITSAEIREIFQNQHDILVVKGGEKILLSHIGTFSQDLVSSLSERVEKLLLSKGDKRSVVKRAFSILIEGLQNIRLHGEKDELDRQIGFVLVGENESCYSIMMANVINPDDFEKVEKYLEEINEYSKNELRETYLSVLSNEFLSHKGGAGLGFITTRMKSGNPLEHSFYALKSGKMLFTFQVRLNRM